MLSGYQTEVVALLDDDGSFYHVSCAAKVYDAISAAKAERGLGGRNGLRPIIRYEFDSYVGEASYEYVTEAHEDDGSAEFQDAWDAMAEVWQLCDHCGEPIN
jgi:hypothetical protein